VEFLVRTLKVQIREAARMARSEINIKEMP
jgi:hypothetical protein